MVCPKSNEGEELRLPLMSIEEPFLMSDQRDDKAGFLLESSYHHRGFRVLR